MTLMIGGLSFADDARELTWEELIPNQGKTEQVQMSDEDLMNGENWDDEAFEEVPATPVYPMGVVEELDGVQAKLPGFVVPLELTRGGKVKEFLLVPYFGACIHYPPPPPNQIVYVKLDKAVEIKSQWDPIWATGELKTESQESDLGSAGYTMAARLVEEYEY